MRPAALARKGVSGLAALMAAPAALLLAPGRAEAILVYNIFDSGPNVTLQASGSIKRNGATTDLSIDCGNTGKIQGNFGILCTNWPVSPPSWTTYKITGPSSFGTGASFAVADSTSGLATFVAGTSQRFSIDPAYVDGASITASAIFNGTSLATLGFTTPGLIAFWQLVGVNGDDGRIELRVGAPAEVPGPLPLFGAAAAFGWSRALRRRIRGASTTTV